LTNGLSGKTNWRETAYSGVAATRLADDRVVNPDTSVGAGGRAGGPDLGMRFIKAEC
jgi:hypothetical protein